MSKHAKFYMKYNNSVFLYEEEFVVAEAGKLDFESSSQHNFPFLFLLHLRFIHAGAGNLSKVL